MSVNPGFGGQVFIPSSTDKIRRLAALREQRGLDFRIAVDGGIGRENIIEVAGAGAGIIIAKILLKLSGPGPGSSLPAPRF